MMFSIPAPARRSSVSRSSPRDDPTQVRWAMVSMPSSDLKRVTSSRVRARVLPPAP